jgi:hypothetical protein
MWTIGLLVTMLWQVVPPAPVQVPPPVPVPLADRVIVGLVDGRQLTVESPEFAGFIHGHGSEALLAYRQQTLHGQLEAKSIARIDFGEYRRNRPFELTVTLKNGQKLEVESERQNYVMLTGKADIGTVTIKHPDPINAPVKLSTRKPDRKHDLTIQYLEFPAL